MQTLEELLAPFDYPFPPELIAREPAHPRDSARLLIYDRNCTGVACNAPTFDVFANITNYLPKNAVLVLNQTKVIPARFHLRKITGGEIEALYIGLHQRQLRVMASGMMRAGDKLIWRDGHYFVVEQRDGKYAILKTSFPIDNFPKLLDAYGETPLPPYIKNSPMTEGERREEYQTVFARDPGSVAAPTAGLHFTPELLQKIKDHGCDLTTVTLHVNLGTFAPLTEEHMRNKKLHEEVFEIDPDTAAFLNKAKKEGRPIIAVGTTAVRTLESASVMGHLSNLSGITSIFIDEHDKLEFVSGLITNFHVPKSSLLMLVSAFVGREKLLDLYAQAIEKRFRLFSFGDGMMIL